MDSDRKLDRELDREPDRELNRKLDRELKEIELDILKAFISACESLGIEYFALGGTLLGAVRHGGFIPWDDDIDVGLKRRDYELFMRRGQELLPEGLFLQNRAAEPEYVMNFAKIRNSNTAFVETSIKELNINHGVYIDIFPLDFLPDSSLSRFSMKLKKKFLRNCVASVFTPASGKSLRTRIIQRLCLLIFGSAAKAAETEERLYKSCTGGRLIVNHCGAWGEKEIVPAELFEHSVKIPFEDIMLKVPIGCEEYLRLIYGNYMELPPEGERVPHHHTELIDTKKSYKEYRKQQ